MLDVCRSFEILFFGKIEELEKRIVENLEFSCN